MGVDQGVSGPSKADWSVQMRVLALIAPSEAPTAVTDGVAEGEVDDEGAGLSEEKSEPMISSTVPAVSSA